MTVSGELSNLHIPEVFLCNANLVAEQHSETRVCAVEQPGLSPAEIVKAAGGMWKGLTKQEKQPYQVMRLYAICAWMQRHVARCLLQLWLSLVTFEGHEQLKVACSLCHDSR